MKVLTRNPDGSRTVYFGIMQANQEALSRWRLTWDDGNEQEVIDGDVLSTSDSQITEDDPSELDKYADIEVIDYR